MLIPTLFRSWLSRRAHERLSLYINTALFNILTYSSAFLGQNYVCIENVTGFLTLVMTYASIENEDFVELQVNKNPLFLLFLSNKKLDEFQKRQFQGESITWWKGTELSIFHNDKRTCFQGQYRQRTSYKRAPREYFKHFGQYRGRIGDWNASPMAT